MSNDKWDFRWAVGTPVAITRGPKPHPKGYIVSAPGVGPEEDSWWCVLEDGQNRPYYYHCSELRLLEKADFPEKP